MAFEIATRFHPDVEGLAREGDAVVLTIAGWSPLRFEPGSSELCDLMARLRGPGLGEAAITAALAGESRRMSSWNDLLDKLTQARLLEWSLRRDGRELACLRPLANRFRPFGAGELAASPALRLSRFAHLRADDGEVILDGGDVPLRVAIIDPALLATIGALMAGAPKPGTEAADLAEVLARFHLMEAIESDADDRAMWSFADRLLHVAARRERDGVIMGGVFRWRGRRQPEPAVREFPALKRIALPRPDGRDIMRRSAPLAEVMERRCSLREPGPLPLQLGELAELLWRTLRQRALREGGGQELPDRPVPAGGSVNEIDIYVSVHRVDGLEPGIYRYRGDLHALELVSDARRLVDRIGRDTAQSMGREPEQAPDAVLLLATRYPRLAYKYEGIAYAITLKNAGVIFEALYLVATDMGLAPCAVGSGDGRQLAAATGIDSYAQAQIGEFALSGRSRPERDNATEGERPAGAPHGT